MKKFLAIILALVMLLPMCLTANAETVTEKPFYGISWENTRLNRELFPNLAGMPAVAIYPKSGVDPYFLYNNYYSNVHPMAKLAIEVRKVLNERPEGLRYMQFMHPRRVFDGYRKDIVDMEAAVQVLKGMVTEFLTEYKKRGGLLDGIIVDLEYWDVHSWYIYAWGYSRDGNKNIYKDIAENPTYQTKIRPMLVERGFKFYENPSGEKSELWSIYPYINDPKYSQCRSIWNTVVFNWYMSECLNEAIYKPMKELYPDAHMSDYQVTDTAGWLKPLSNEGNPSFVGGNKMKAGDTSNLNTYLVQPLQSFYETNGKAVYKNPFSYNKAVYDNDSFNMFLWDINRFKDMYDATDTGRVNVWVSEYDAIMDDYYEKRESSVRNSPYYSELLFHIGLMNPDVLLIYFIPPDRPDLTKQEELDQRFRVISDCMEELTRVAGTSDRKAIPISSNWNEGFVLSGIYAGGRNVWRITPDTTDGTTLESFKVSNKAPTFSARGKTITFPQGRIIETGDISEVGNCGYWVETPANVTPVIVSDTDRFAENPSHIEDFEYYANGTTFNAESLRHKETWEITGAAAKVQADGSNKVLAITGTTSLANVQLPQNITAGDSYAKNQAWEVSFKLPQGMSGELKLLTCGGDGGFKVSGNSLYYDKQGSYLQFSGVTLSANTKYTVKRELDFNNFTSSYTLYDASGKTLAQMNSIPMNRIELPVEKIGISCSDLGSKVVYIDDYKLYPTGLATDFEVYNANTGILATNQSQAQSTDTAYRLSWLNGTAAAKKATVYAAYYNGSTQVGSPEKVEEVTMAPGADGVATGVVKNKAGMTVKVYMQVGDTTIAAQPNYDNGNFSWTSAWNALRPDAEYITGEDTGNAGGTTGGTTGGDNTGNTGNTGGNTGSTGGNTGSTGNTDETTDGNTEETTDSNTGNTEGNTGGNADNTEGTTGGNTGSTEGADGATESTQCGNTDGTKDPAKKGNGWVWIVVVVILVLGGLGAGAYFLIQKKQKEAAALEAEPAEIPETEASTEEDQQLDSTENTDSAEPEESAE